MHYRSCDRARLIYSASIRRQTTETPLKALIGRANCFHTWHDILRFQRQGIETYDFGGWYGGTENAEKLRINRFKESFGGKVVPEFNYEVGVTIAGRLALALKAIVFGLLDLGSNSVPRPVVFYCFNANLSWLSFLVWGSAVSLSPNWSRPRSPGCVPAEPLSSAPALCGVPGNAVFGSG